MGQGGQQQVNIKTAAKYLKVSEKTIMRYMSKGILSRVREGARTFVLIDELRGLRTRTEKEQKRTKTKEETIFLSKTSYNELLSEVGALRERCNNLLEYRYTNDKLSKELDTTRQQVDETNQFFKEILVSDQQKAAENEELRRTLEVFQKELDQVKKRGIFARIFNK